MTTMITLGTFVGGYQILSLAAGGKTAIVTCRCGGTHAVSVEALLAGWSCPARPLPPDRRMALAQESDERQRRADRDWRPGR